MRATAVLAALTLFMTGCSDDSTNGAAEVDGPTTTTADATTTTTAATTDPAVLPIELCSDIDEPVPSVIGTLAGGTNTPWELDGVLSTYVAEHTDTYAGRWIDRDHGGVVVLAFTDDPAPHLEEVMGRRPMESDIAAINPRPPITVDWTVAESGYAVDVVQVRFTETELAALQSEASQALFNRDDVRVVGMGSGNKLNRVTLDLIRPTADHLALIAAEYPGRADMFCLDGPLWDESMAPPSVDEPFTVMADAGEDPLVTCGGEGPFALSVLDGDPDVDPTSDDPLIVALLTSSMEGQSIPQTGWRTLSRDDEHALFGNFENEAVLRHSFENTVAGWSLRGTSAGECRLRLAVPDGVGIMEVGLDPEHPVDPASTTLRLVVMQQGCSGGASGVENMRPPEVIETDTEIRIAIGVVPPEGFQTCPGNESAPITIELDSPIGERALLDGLRVPPVPIDVLDF